VVERDAADALELGDELDAGVQAQRVICPGPVKSIRW